MATSKFDARSTALDVVKGLHAKLDAKIVLITGATSGNEIEKDEINEEKDPLIISRHRS